MSEDLLTFLRKAGLLPKLEEEVESANKKWKVLGGIRDAARSWCQSYLGDEGVAGEELERKHVEVLPSGSFALGMNDPDSDLDLVLLASAVVSRDDFFSTFRSSLEVHLPVEHYQALALNRCPLVKMTVDNVKVDLTLAIHPGRHLDEVLSFTGDDLDEREVAPLLRMTEQCATSLNGNRNMAAILNMVPDSHTFRGVLCAVKLWAKRRQIYSHSIGYLGGAAWSAMVAFVCCQHRGLNEMMTLKKFFEVYSDWPWPKPLLLKELTNIKSDFHPWNPKDDHHHLMPIIQPCHPEINCAFNVNALTRSTVREEIKRGRSVLCRLYDVDSEVLGLFEPFEFFVKFRSFLVIILSTESSTEEHLHWRGLVESRVRFLLVDLSRMATIKSARVLPDSFLFTDGAGHHNLTKWYVGLELSRHNPGGPGSSLDISREIEKFKSIVFNRSKEYGWSCDGKKVEVVNLNKPKGDESGDTVKNFLPELAKDLRPKRNR